MSLHPTRRSFIRSAGAAAAAVWTSGPAILHARRQAALRIAVIGCGGRGGDNLESVAGEHIAAICDVDRNTLAKVAAAYPKARQEVDFRRLFDHAGEFDAVVVSTAEHTHAFATLPALQLKKHVYCEKPLTHNVEEARIIREAAAKAGVATQMGTQIHAGDNYRRVVELIQAGAIGPVSECHVWVGRAWGWHASEADAKAAPISCSSRTARRPSIRCLPALTGTSGSALRRPGRSTRSTCRARSGIAGGTSATAR